MPDGAPSGDDVWVVLDRTPFYAERGGQVGDSGWITGPHGRLRVRTTQAPAGDLIVHLGRVESGSLSEGDEVRAEVDAAAREATMRHHTATHLLHAALRAELGPHVHQTGSLVAPDRLRFDFSHGDPLTPQQRLAVQGRINEAIRRNLPVRTDVMPVDEAMRSGAVALFDERYGDTVRVLTIGDVSKELCGGTHVRQTGEIGEFVFTTEGSIGSGTRRVEALAGGPAEDFVNRQLDTLEHVARTLEVPPQEVPARVQRLQGELAEARRRLEGAERKLAQQGLQRAPGAGVRDRRTRGAVPPPGGGGRPRSRADDGALAGGGGLAAGQAGRSQRPAPGLRPQRQPAAPGHGEQGPHRAGPARRAAAQ